MKVKAVNIFKIATANALTLHPADETRLAEQGRLDSHRRLDSAAQFQRLEYTVVVIQETRLSRPRAFPIGPFAVCAAAAGERGQAGIELWIRDIPVLEKTAFRSSCVLTNSDG